MGIFASQEERNLKWSDMSGKLKGIMVLMIGLVFLMATALSLGIEPDGEGRLETLVRGLLGQGYVKSMTWLWIARLSLVGIAVSVIAIRREQKAIVAERRKQGLTNPEPKIG